MDVVAEVARKKNGVLPLFDREPARFEFPRQPLRVTDRPDRQFVGVFAPGEDDLAADLAVRRRADVRLGLRGTDEATAGLQNPMDRGEDADARAPPASWRPPP